MNGASGIGDCDPWPPSRMPHQRGDGPCNDCFGPNVVWFTDDLVWNRVVRDHDDSDCILCIDCFIARAEHYYDVSAWKLSIAPVLVERTLP